MTDAAKPEPAAFALVHRGDVCDVYAERKEAERELERRNEKYGDIGERCIVPLYTAAQMEAARVQEREAAAKIAEDAEIPHFRHGGQEFDDGRALCLQIAAAIRSRSSGEAP